MWLALFLHRLLLWRHNIEWEEDIWTQSGQAPLIQAGAFSVWLIAQTCWSKSSERWGAAFQQGWSFVNSVVAWLQLDAKRFYFSPLQRRSLLGGTEVGVLHEVQLVNWVDVDLSPVMAWPQLQRQSIRATLVQVGAVVQRDVRAAETLTGVGRVRICQHTDK